MKNFTLLLLSLSALALFLTACNSEGEDAAAAVATDVVTDVATDVVPPPTVPAATDTTTADPTDPPADPTDPPPTASDAPTLTPPPTAAPTEIPAQPVDAITLAPVIEGGLQRPLYLTHAFDERLFVVEQAGKIRIISDGALLPEPFLDISGRVSTAANEQGLLSVAFPPDYPENGRFYVDYTDVNGDTVVSAFQVSAADPHRADPNSEQILLTVDQPYGNHNGGLLKFGPDGYLYVGLGDGGSADDPLGNGQNPATLLGTILRLDVSATADGYAVPADNPFVDDESRAAEIWAWGLRNPWRFTFDRQTGDLYIADVGQNMWEEVNVEAAASPGGRNYGWNIMEAGHCFLQEGCDTEGLVLPIFEYDHSQGCSVTGGYVYRGQQFPELNGNYFLADYCLGTIWRLFPTASGEWSSAVVLQSNRIISSFGEDVNGELYVISHGDGAVYQVQP